MDVPISAVMLEALEPLAEAVGPVACVSTCSGTDEAAHEVVRRTSSLVEAMEGAAAGLAARRVGGTSVEAATAETFGVRGVQQRPGL